MSWEQAGVTLEVAWPAPADAPLVRGSAAWLRPRVIEVHVHQTSTGVWSYLTIRGWQRDADRWARGQYGEHLTQDAAGRWVAPGVPWLELPQLLIFDAHDAAVALHRELPANP